VLAKAKSALLERFKFTGDDYDDDRNIFCPKKKTTKK
jgi:hypothetical protein